jgi:hypothetical protein
MAEITLPYRWKPRPYQREAWKYLSEGGKRLVMRWHRRAGKDDMLLHHTCCAMHQKKGTYWYMLPEYSQARKSMWIAINPHTGTRRIDEVFPVELRKRTLEQEMLIEMHCGSTFQLVGSDNFDSLVGSPPVGLVFSEYALSNPTAWSYLRPILLENGGWAAFNSTPRGANHFKQMCELADESPGWFYDVKTVDETGVFTAEQLAEELREMQKMNGEAFGKSLWMQEYYVSFDAAIPGSVFGEWLDRIQLAGQICDVPCQPKFPVHTAWDLGRTDATAIWWFQIIFGEIHVIDYHESSLRDVPYYTDLLKARAKDGGFTYGTHWLPHDARARTLASGGKSIQQQFMGSDVGRVVIAKRLDHQDGIQAARATIPYCWFDAKKTEYGREVLRNYHYEWDAEKRKFTDMPAHDWSSHGSSAFRTLSLSWVRPKNAAPEAPIMERLLATNPNRMTFGALRDKHLARMRRERNESAN